MLAAITKIKEAEDAGEAAVKKAAEEAQNIAKAAAAAARERRKAILDEAGVKREDILRQAHIDAEKACIPLTEAAKIETERILHPDEKLFNETVNAVMDKLTQGR